MPKACVRRIVEGMLCARSLCHAKHVLAGYGNLSGLLFAVVFTGGLLSPTTRDVWRIVGWCLLDAAAASATIAFVGFWVMATSAREVGL